MIIDKKERKQIYLDAAKYFSKNKNERLTGSIEAVVNGFCDYLHCPLKGKNGRLYDYYEYCSFEPEFLQEKSYWFDVDDQSERISVLIKCAKMCD